MIENLKKIPKIITKDQFKKFKLLIAMMILCALLETFSIGALIPLINYLTNADLMLSINDNILKISSYLGLSEYKPINLILFSIVLIYSLKNIYLTFFHWVDCKFAFVIRTTVAIRLFKIYLNKPYIFHVYNNSSSLITNIVEESKIFGNVMMFVNSLVTEIMIITGLLIFLFILNPLITLSVVTLGCLFGILFYLLIKNKVALGGQRRLNFAKTSTKYLYQGLGAIKDLIFLNAQENFTKIYSDNIFEHGKITGTQNFMQRLPRIWFEMSLITIILFIIFYLSSIEVEFSSVLGTVAIFIITAARIVPSLNKVLVSIQYLKFAEPSLKVLSKDFEYTKPASKNFETKERINFNKTLKYKNISYKYPNSNKIILKNVNFEINKNEFIGIVGKSGAGKSTLVDLMTGLLKVDSGDIIVDDLNLKENFHLIKNSIGYVSQNIFLTDDTIKQNIAFGVDGQKIDDLKIEKAIATSQLAKFINNLELGVNTVVGERGIKISGGERQRIGIARALYNNPSILIFDEATSALDLETEKEILETLIKLKGEKTIIFITHRVSILKYCNKVYQLENSDLKIKEK